MDNNEQKNLQNSSGEYVYTNQYNYTEQKKSEDQRKDNTAHDLAIASMILGIISVVSSLVCCCSFFSWGASIISGIIGIVLGGISKDSKGKRENLAMIGIICSIIGIFISIIVIILVVILGYADYNGYFNEFY